MHWLSPANIFVIKCAVMAIVDIENSDQDYSLRLYHREWLSPNTAMRMHAAHKQSLSILLPDNRACKSSFYNYTAYIRLWHDNCYSNNTLLMNKELTMRVSRHLNTKYREILQQISNYLSAVTPLTQIDANIYESNVESIKFSITSTNI